jgi:hypothetical protein
LNSLIDIAGETKIKITIGKDVAVRTNIAKTILLAATMRTDSKSILARKL